MTAPWTPDLAREEAEKVIAEHEVRKQFGGCALCAYQPCGELFQARNVIAMHDRLRLCEAEAELTALAEPCVACGGTGIETEEDLDGRTTHSGPCRRCAAPTDPPEGLKYPCSNCGKPVESEREQFFTPICYTCFPRPEPPRNDGTRCGAHGDGCECGDKP